MTAALWGSNHVVARAARDAAPLPALVFWRWLPALIILYGHCVAVPAARLAEIRPRLGELTIGGVVGVGLFSFLLIGGAYQSSAIEVGFINATTPVWVVLIGWIVGQGQIARMGQVGLALAFVGTLLIISKGDLLRLTGLQLNLRKSLVASRSDLLCVVLDPCARMVARDRNLAAHGGDCLGGSPGRVVAGLCHMGCQRRSMVRLDRR